MSLASSSLQKAVFVALSNDPELLAMIGPDAISDHPQTGVASPQVRIGAIDSGDWSTAGDDGEEHLLTLEIRGEGEGHRDVELIAARIHAVLHHRDLPIEGFHLVDFAWQSTRVRRDGRGHVAEIRFRGLTE